MNCKKTKDPETIFENRIKAAFTQEELPPDLYDRVDMTLGHAGEHQRYKGRYRWAFIAAGVALIIAIFGIGSFKPTAAYQDIQQFSREAVLKHLKNNHSMSFNAQQAAQTLPLFSRELKFNVILPDIQDKGYLLLGGRLCAVGACRAVYLFYEKDNRICSLFIVDYNLMEFNMADGSRYIDSIRGCQTEIWKEKGQVYAMVQGIP